MLSMRLLHTSPRTPIHANVDTTTDSEVNLPSHGAQAAAARGSPSLEARLALACLSELLLGECIGADNV